MYESKKQLVSIGLPTFNRGNAELLVRAIESLLAQSYTNFELIISDNCSADDTEKICREYAKKDDRIRYFRQEKNIGMISQFDFLFSKIEGNYFMLTSDDDWWHPDFILKLKEALDRNPKYGIAMSSIRQIHEDGSLFNEIIYDGPNNLSKFSYGQVFNAVIYKKPPAHFFICGLFRKEVIKNLFWESAPRVLGGDKVLMYEASLLTHFYSIPDILWVRTSTILPDAKRYTGDYKKVFVDKRAYLKHIRASISRLVRTPNISLTRKLTFLPIKIPVLVWAYKKHLVRESFVVLRQLFHV